ncbi:TPA: AAA family ATPase [Escherichia coli]|nr:hypothetical protein [Escherichia coli]TFS14896.1 hypothetical protein ELT51_25105 [Escherichia coli]HAN8656324.1 AAA family ATPase [Escherichia coli]
MAFPPGSTVIVDQGEKLSLKETLTLLDGAARHNVQVLITDSGQRTGTGSALMAMKDAGVNTYRWQGGEQRPATIISEPDRNVRYARLAGDFAASVKAGEESVAQVSGVREQAILTEAIRSELKTQGVLGHPEVTMTALSPVWLDSRSRYLRDMYRPGMVMEQWNPETRSHDRYVIDRVTAQSHSLTLRDAQGETQVVRISSLDSSWSLFRPEKMPVADGERLRVTGKIPGLRVSGGDRLQVASVSEDAMTVVVPGRAEPATLPVADSPFTALKLENGWVETPGHSVSDSATVFASVTQMAMDNATLNGLARSGRDVRLYSSLDEPRTAEKLARQRSGETPDFSNTLFLLDESSMVGNTDMARAYALIAAGGGRAVASGDTDQLQAIAPGQPFRLQQTRSAADVVIMKEIVRQTPELREAVYSLINRDVERALSGLESVKPSQVPRQEGAWAPEHSVTEFSHSQEAKLAEAQQKAMLKGEAFPDIPMTLYEAIVRDYTGRTPEAREQTLIVTHLNEDRRVLNSMIHDAREKAGELGKEQVMVPVLNTANIRDGELRRLSTWENNPDALALVDSVYHRIAGISKDDGLISEPAHTG